MLTRCYIRLWAVVSLMAFLFPIQVGAQSLQVTEPVVLQENDVTAMTEGKTDRNGERAALIKIVTNIDGLSFDGGSLGIVEAQRKVGEWWLYVPKRIQRISIAHPRYGQLTKYAIPVDVEAGRTYRMSLDIEGKVVLLQASVPGAMLEVDGEPLGRTPQRVHLAYGPHRVRSAVGRMEGEATFAVSRDAATDTYTLQMSDMSRHFGRVNVNVDGNAYIWFDGKRQAAGHWETELREGSYTLTTQKAECDSAVTTFTVIAGRRNTVTAIAPTPYKGFLHLNATPVGVRVAENGNDITADNIELSVGRHELTFSRSGYHTERREVAVFRDEERPLNIRLKRVEYIKRTGFYFGAMYTLLTSQSAVGGMAGATLYGVDIQLGYAVGLAKTDKLNVYTNDGTLKERCDYTTNVLSAKLGYQVSLATRVTVTPQVGYTLLSLKSSGNYGDGATSGCFSVGAKFQFAPAQRFSVFVAPEYAIKSKSDEQYSAISKNTDVREDGFILGAGMLFNF